MSQGQEIILLRALSEVQDRGLATFHTTLAKKSCTLTKWAAQGHEKCFASNARTFRIDSSGFLQGQSTAEFKTLNALDLIQTVLLKPELKDCVTLTDGIDQFFDEAKEEKCIGGEGWCGSRWNKSHKRIERGTGTPRYLLTTQRMGWWLEERSASRVTSLFSTVRTRLQKSPQNYFAFSRC